MRGWRTVGTVSLRRHERIRLILEWFRGKRVGAVPPGGFGDNRARRGSSAMSDSLFQFEDTRQGTYPSRSASCRSRTRRLLCRCVSDRCRPTALADWIASRRARFAGDRERATGSARRRVRSVREEGLGRGVRESQARRAHHPSGLGHPRDDPVAMAWLALTGHADTSLNRLAHRRAYRDPRPLDDEVFLRFWEEMLQILDYVLERFQALYAVYFSEIDRMVSERPPSDLRRFPRILRRLATSFAG